MATKQAEAVENSLEVTRRVAADEEIWAPDEIDPVTEEKMGRFLSIEEQIGVVVLELTKPTKVSDREELITEVEIVAPDGDAIDNAKGKVRSLIGKCVMGINPRDLGKLPGRDYLRIQNLIRHFLL